MAVEDIVKKIIKDSEGKAESILLEYKKQADDIKEEKKSLLKGTEEAEKKKIEQDADNHYKRLVQMAELQMRKEVLDLKQKLITDVFQKVEERIVSMPKDDYQSFIEKKIIEYIQTGREEVIISENDKNRITEDFIEKLNKKLKEKLREEGDLKLSDKSADIKAGFILKSEKIQYNSSLESMLRELREKDEAEIVKKIFKE